MKFEWHEAKSRLNVRKHGINFEAARRVFDDPYALMLLDKAVEGEERWRAIGRSGVDVVLVVAHTVKRKGSEDIVRIISARKALGHERKRYEDQAS